MIRSSSAKTLRIKRHRRVRAKVSGTALRPRVTVFRSNRSLFVQAIDDVSQKTLAASSLASIKKTKNDVSGAHELGKVFGEKCLSLHIKEVVFDRAGYRYHGKVKALAEGIREAGIRM